MARDDDVGTVGVVSLTVPLRAPAAKISSAEQAQPNTCADSLKNDLSTGSVVKLRLSDGKGRSGADELGACVRCRVWSVARSTADRFRYRP